MFIENKLFEDFLEEVKMLLFWAGPIAGDNIDKTAAQLEEENVSRLEYLIDKIEHNEYVSH